MNVFTNALVTTHSIDSKVTRIIKTLERNAPRKAPRMTDNMDCESDGNSVHLNRVQAQGKEQK